MKRFSQTFHSISIAWCAVLIYAVLAAMSAGCALAHAGLVKLMTRWANPDREQPAYLLVLLLVFLFMPSSVGAESGERWQRLIQAGTAAREQARYKEAEELFLAAGQEAQQFGPADERMATTLNSLGLVFHELGHYARAKFHYEQALAIWEQALGAEHADVATAQVSTLRERLLKLAVWVERSVRRVVLHLPQCAPWGDTWRRVAVAVPG